MADKLGPLTETIEGRRINEAICIDTARVYDSCADKDCLSDLRVYFTDTAENIISLFSKASAKEVYTSSVTATADR